MKASKQADLILHKGHITTLDPKYPEASNLLGAMLAGATGLVLALPLFGVVAVIGETVSQVVADRRLRARYRAARQIAASCEKI